MKNITKKKICYVDGGLDIDPDTPSAFDPNGGTNPNSEPVPWHPVSVLPETSGEPDPEPLDDADGGEPGAGSGTGSASGTLPNPSDLTASLHNGKIKSVKYVLDDGTVLSLDKPQQADTETTPDKTDEQPAQPSDTWTILGWTWKKKYWIMSGSGLLVLLVVLIVLATKKN